MIDFHTHILPDMDDGSKNVSESIEMAKMMYKNGTYTICATPHYYRENENITEFLARRQDRYEALKAALDEAGVNIKIVLGAEVKFFRNISRKDFSQLCYDNTRYMLVEMPFSKWTVADLRELMNLELVQGITPILAHIERYIKFGNKIKEIEKLGFPLQINAETLLKFGQRRRYMSFINTRNGVVLGSDAHDKMIRAPNLHKAEKAIEKRFGKIKLTEIERTENIILNLNGKSRSV